LESGIASFIRSQEQIEMNKEIISTADAPKAIGPYEQAVKAGEWVYVSGQIPLDPKSGSLVEGDIAVQTRRVMENLKAVVEAAGSSFDRVVKTTVFLKNIADFPAMNEVYGGYFGTAKPARSTVAVAALPRGALVEIDLVALA
jgi:2-iminobutanoate/2-iminopropanoate deaminase